MKEKIAFPQLVELVAVKASTTNRMSELFLQELFATVTQALGEEQSVKIKGLGSFKVIKENKSKDVLFTPDKSIADAVNAPFAQFTPVELSDEITDEQLAAIDDSMAPQDHQEKEPQPEPEQTIEPEQELLTLHETETEPEPQKEETHIEPVIDTVSTLQQPNKTKTKRLWIALAALATVIAIIIGIVVLNKSANNIKTPVVATDTIASKTTVTNTATSDTTAAKSQQVVDPDSVASIKKAIKPTHKYQRYTSSLKSKKGKPSKYHAKKSFSKHHSYKARKHYRHR